ncbi:MAG: SDR family oxidoreductase [Acidobacteriota bacterium]
MSRVSFITGGVRGIGFATAEALLGAGHQVAITGTSEQRLRQAVQELRARVGQSAAVQALTCDVREAASVESAIREVVASFGGLDVLVNNAGVGLGAPIVDLPHDEWRRIIDTNLTGVFHCCKAAIPHLRRRGGGWIINISSLSSTAPFAGGAAYCASKAGLNAFSEALMQELRDDNIRVSCVLPGSVATGFSGRTPEAGADWKLRPEDVAQAVLSLLSHDTRSLPSRVEIRPSRPRKS